MNVPRERSGIFQDLLDLERDFKYNLALLRIRDCEIERCSKTNRDLRETLKSCLSANGKLKSDVATLEHALAQSERERSRQGRADRALVDTLTETLNEIKRNQQDAAQKRESEIRAMERSYADALGERRSEFGRDVGEIKARLQEEMILVAKMKQQLKDLTDENISISNKLRDSNAQHASEISFYKSELDASRSEIENRKTECRRIAAVNDEVKSNLSEKLLTIDGLIKTNGERENDYRKLNALYVECRGANDELSDRADRLSVERDRLRDEVARLKANADSSQVQGKVSDGGKYEAMSKQNVVLQEIVKSMRREREEAIAKREIVDVRRAEMRIEKMECVVEQLKQNAVKTNEIEL